MFTGIIQNLGKAINFSNGELEVTTLLDLSDCSVGSSICCNGVCLTTTEIEFKSNLHYFKATVGVETQQRTTFSNNLFNELISMNLEKSLKIGDEISGHFVYGHVDRTTELLKVNNFNNSWEFCFKNFQDESKKYIVDKASIAINGISLTIANVSADSFSISVIPHTYENTNLKLINENDIVTLFDGKEML